MCTLSVIQLSDVHGERGYRVVFNRDESRDRAEGMPPREMETSEVKYVAPLDTDSGGTWIGVNEFGVTVGLLNVYRSDGDQREGAVGLKSRGEVIEKIIGGSSAKEVAKAAADMDTERYAAFRIVAVDGAEVIEVGYEGGLGKMRRMPAHNWPVMFTSSGLGDAVVQGIREKLFQDMVYQAEDLQTAQDAFSASRIAGAGHLSVNMSRSDARTVSQTAVCVLSSVAKMQYSPMPPERGRMHGHEITVNRPTCA